MSCPRNDILMFEADALRANGITLVVMHDSVSGVDKAADIIGSVPECVIAHSDINPNTADSNAAITKVAAIPDTTVVTPINKNPTAVMPIDRTLCTAVTLSFKNNLRAAIPVGRYTQKHVCEEFEQMSFECVPVCIMSNDGEPIYTGFRGTATVIINVYSEKTRRLRSLIVNGAEVPYSYKLRTSFGANGFPYFNFCAILDPVEDYGADNTYFNRIQLIMDSGGVSTVIVYNHGDAAYEFIRA